MFKLAAFDFDYTIVNLNSSNYLNKLVIEREQHHSGAKTTPSVAELNKYKHPPEIEALKNDHDTTIRYSEIYKRLHSEFGLRKKHIEKCLADIEINANMKKLFENLHNSGYTLIIISDSNNFVIETILSNNGLLHLFGNGRNVFANRAHFDQSEMLILTPYDRLVFADENRFNCEVEFCRQNICKGSILECFIQKNCPDKSSQKRIVYVGDGSIDYCAGRRLNESDTFFVKKNSALSRLIADAKYADKIRAKVNYWKNAQEIIDLLGDQ